MKALELVQGYRRASAAIQKLDLVVLTTYTDRAAMTVDTVYYFAAQTCYYDWANTGTVCEFEPYLVRVESSGDVMTHLPRSGSIENLKRSRVLMLRNGDRDGEKLYKTLSAQNLELATVEIATLLIDGTAADRFNALESFDGDEHTYFYRGRVAEVADVSVAEIALRLESDTPQLYLIPVSDPSQNEPADLGKNLPVVYGSMPHVPAIGWTVGAFTTLAEDITGSQTGVIELTSVSGIADESGTGRLGDEVVAWTGTQASPPALVGVTRGQSNTAATAHTVGQGLLELLATYVFVVAGHESTAVSEVYAHNSVRELVRITTGYTVNLSNTSLVSGKTVTSVSFTQTEYEAMLDNLGVTALIAQQATVSHSSFRSYEEGPVDVSHGEVGDNLTSSLIQLDGNPSAFGNPPTSVWAQFPLPISGTVVSQVIRVYASNLGGSSGPGSGFARASVGVGNSANFTSEIASWLDNNSGWREFPTQDLRPVVRVSVGTVFGGGVPGSTFSHAKVRVHEIRRIVTVQEGDPVVTDAALGAAGAKLPIFADIDGLPVPLEYTTRYSMDSDSASWTASGGTPTDEATTVKEGAGSLKLTSDGPGAADVDRSFATEDWTAKRLKLWVYIDNAASLSTSDGVRIHLGSNASGSNSSAWHFGTVHGLKAGAWAELELDPTDTADATAGSQLTLTDVEYLRLEFNVVGGATSRVVYFDDVRLSDASGTASSDYQASQGALIEKPVDILRHFIAQLSGLGESAVDSLATVNTNLGSNKHALILETMGLDFMGVLDRLGYEFRINVIQRETATGTVYSAFAAESDYEWPASSRTLTLWASIQQSSRSSEGLTTRRNYVYQVDPAQGTGDADGYLATVRIDADQNDVSNPSTSELEAAEAAYGRRDGISTATLLATQDETTALEIAGYYSHEDIRKAGTYTLREVPHVESYDLERGDVVSFLNDNTGTLVKGRVTSVARNPQTETSELVVIEVP